jgi:hypothetical protein
MLIKKVKGLITIKRKAASLKRLSTVHQTINGRDPTVFNKKTCDTDIAHPKKRKEQQIHA